MSRNYGIPPGCDWPKPPGCRCNNLLQAEACEERCDDSLYEPDPTRFKFRTWILFAAVAIWVTVFFFVGAHAAEIPTCDMVIRENKPRVVIMYPDNFRIAPALVEARRCTKRAHRN